MRKIYLVFPTFQEKEVTAYCFGDCGKVTMRIIDVGVAAGITCPCENCPHVEETEDLGDSIIARKLIPLPAPAVARREEREE